MALTCALLVACGEVPLEGDVEQQLSALSTDPTVAFVSPANNLYITQQQPATPVTVTFKVTNWAPYPAPGKEVRLYRDDLLVAAVTDGALSAVVEDVPFGLHSLALQLYEDGAALPFETARAVRYVRITGPCEEALDCEEGNPCSDEGCIYTSGFFYECHWGMLPGCCHTLFDCPVGTAFCADVDGDGLPQCVECTSHLHCDDANPCSEDLCVDGLCENLPAPASCATDADCDDGDPCTSEVCLPDPCVCQTTPVEGCCNVDAQCDDGNSCNIDRCINHVCRHGSKYMGAECCTEDSDCVPETACDVAACIKGDGTVGICTSSPDPAKPACCKSDAECPDLSQKWLGTCLYNGTAGYYKCTHYLNPEWCETPAGGLVINELMVNPAVVLDSLAEWVELVNAGDGPVDLSGYLLEGGSGASCLLFPGESHFLAPGEAAVVARLSDSSINGGVAVDFACGLDLSLENGSDSLTLFAPGGSVEDSVAWAPAWPVGAGASLARKSPYADAGSVASWQAGTRPFGTGDNRGTPGEPNSDLGPPPDTGICDDGVACTLDLCHLSAAHMCDHVEMDSCCLDDDSCGDGNVCTTDFCTGGVCTNTAVPGCCNLATECDDDDECTVDACINHVCRHGSKVLGQICCVDDTDCDFDTPCVLGTCTAGACVFETIDGCCTYDWQCSDGDLCTDDTCDPVSHECEQVDDPTCCTTAAECEAVKPAAFYCRPSYCIGHGCKYGAPAPGCCALPKDCDDSNPCTADACNPESHTCHHETVAAGCCNSAAECDDDGDPCTAAACVANECVHPKIPSCCIESSDCGDDNPCTEDLCVGQTCHYVVAEGSNCCQEVADCHGDGLQCTVESCTGQLCTSTLQSPCFTTLDYRALFDKADTPEEAGIWPFYGGTVAPDDPPAWALSGEGLLGPDAHLRLEATKGAMACAATPFLMPAKQATEVTVSFDLAATLTAGHVVAEVRRQTWPETDTWLTVWTQVLPETTVLHENVTLTLVGPVQQYRRYALCFKPFGADSVVEVDSLVVATGTPPEFLTFYPTVPGTPGALVTRSLRAQDLDKAPFATALTFALSDSPSWVDLGATQTTKKTTLYQSSLLLTPPASVAPGDYEATVRVYDTLLYDEQRIGIHLLDGPCTLDSHCEDGNSCTAEGCVDGKCVYQSLVPCCGNGKAEETEQCDDGNVMPGDGCAASCTLEDNDWDGLFDYEDNCPWTVNPEQGDADGDGFGDPCDPDSDGDGVANEGDNCPDQPNGGQYDNDLDGSGDACDGDDDNDGVEDGLDNCPWTANPGQVDAEGDGQGDLCDPDDDDDGTADGEDNCPKTANPGQEDLDGDGAGDACDEDADGDGYDVAWDCDDADDAVLPAWHDLAPGATGKWRWHPRPVLGPELLYAASPNGTLEMYGYGFDGESESAETDDDYGYAPLAATASFTLWELSGKADADLYLETGDWFYELATPGLQPSSVVATGNAFAWLQGSGVDTEVHLWKEGVHFVLTSNSLAESHLSFHGNDLVWQQSGEIFWHDGGLALPLTLDAVVDERPRVWNSQVVWVRRDGAAGSGNIVLVELATGTTTWLTKDGFDDGLAEIGPFGAAWKRANGAGTWDIAWWDREVVQVLPAIPFDAVESIRVGSHFVAWVGVRDGSRALHAWDGTDVVTLATHLPPGRVLAASEERLAWVGNDGPHVARWICTSQVDLDGDGIAGLGWGGDDCDDLDAAVSPQVQTIDLTMGAVGAPSAPSLHAGQVTWAASDGKDHEVYFYDGKGIVALTANATEDTQPHLHDGVVVWTAEKDDSTVVMRYDGKTLVPVSGSEGGHSPRTWGDRVAWQTGTGALSQLHLHTPTGGTVLVTASPIQDQGFSLSTDTLAWATLGTDSDIRVYDIATGTTTDLGTGWVQEKDPRAWGDLVVWRAKITDWEVWLYDGTKSVALTSNSDDELSAVVHRQRQAWVTSVAGQTDLWVRHPDGVAERLSDDLATDGQLSLAEPLLAWVKGTGTAAELYLWDGSEITRVTDDEVEDSAPSADGGMVAWLHGNDIYLRKTGCGADLDKDGIANAADNCPDLYNPNQGNLDSDALGDICDPDDDGDLVPDLADNCPSLTNPGQGDVDGDGEGNECDPDADGDGHLSTVYGGDDCDDLDAASLPTWPPQLISGGVPDNGDPVINEEAAAWHGKLFGYNQIFTYRDGILFQLTDDLEDDEKPFISGTMLVWEHHDGHDREIYYSNLDQVFALTKNERIDRGPHTDGQSIVWYGSDGNDFEIFHWNGQETIQVTWNSKNDYHPHVSGDLIVWRGFDGNDYEIFMKRGGTIYNISKNEEDDAIPDIDGTSVVWSRYDGNDYEIMLWKDEELKQLTKNGQDDVDPVLDGNKAVWRRWDGHDYEIAYYTGLVSVQLTNDDMEKGPPMLSEGRVVWAARSGVQDDWEIYTYKAGKTVQVTKNSSQDVAPSVNGDTIIWRNNDAIFMAERTCK